MTLSDTIRKAALGPTPKPSYRRGVLLGNWLGDFTTPFFHAVWTLGHDNGWESAPEEVQRMFLLFCAEDCES